jgi:hypothetical protein
MLVQLTTSIVAFLSTIEKKGNSPMRESPGLLSILSILKPEKKPSKGKCSSKAENPNLLLSALLTAGSAFRFAEGSWVRAPAGSQGSHKTVFFFTCSNQPTLQSGSFAKIAHRAISLRSARFEPQL